MLQIGFIRENRDFVVERLGVKNFPDAESKIDNVIALDNQRRNTQTELDNIKAEANRLAKEIGMLFKQGKSAEAEELKAKTGECKVKEKELGEQLSKIEWDLRDILLTIPNLPSKDVPCGKGAEDNEIVHQEGEIPQLYAGAVEHWTLCAKYDIIDFELGTKITGAGFPVYKSQGAKLQRALINFFLDEAGKNGFTEVQPPLMVNEASALATGQLPDKEGQMYHATADNLYLIPTAEVPVTNIFRDVILSEKELPQKMCAYSACFRREAGAAGKDTRGLVRVHQFLKTEQFVICKNDINESEYWHKKLLQISDLCEIKYLFC